MVLDRVHTEKSDSGDSIRPLRMLSYITAAMVSIFVAWFTGYIRIDGTLDTDGWFLLATGREIVHNGIPFENPWSLDSGQGIIVQQWLHDVWLYGWYSLAGYTGVATSVVVPLAIAAIAYYFLIERLTRGCRHQGITWLLYAVGFFYMFTYISIRPTLWSAGCLFVTLNILFAWHEDGNVRALWLLPAVTLLQVNLQAAMWPLCLAACLSWEGYLLFVAWLTAVFISSITSCGSSFVDVYSSYSGVSEPALKEYFPLPESAGLHAFPAV